MTKLSAILAAIESLSQTAAQALAPADPSIAADVALGSLAVALIQQLLPHAKAAAAPATAPAA